MKVLGVDFTSAPGRDKAIVVALCQLERSILVVEDFVVFRDWPAYELWLSKEDRWIGGFDFPFGLPQRFVKAQYEATDWPTMVRSCVNQGKQRFAAAAMEAFQAAQQKLDKHRLTDLGAGSESPLKTLANPPVGKMFYEGAWRLLAHRIHIPVLNETGNTKIAVEAYPGLLVRRLNERFYKNDTSRSASKNLAARKRIIHALEARSGNSGLPAKVRLRRRSLRKALYEPSGDWLDSVMCAMQAAWAWQQRKSNFGIPKDVNVVEGWIVSS